MASTIRVRATIRTMGLEPRQEAEVGVNDLVKSNIAAGFLVVLEDAVEAVEAQKEEKAPKRRQQSPESTQGITEVAEGE